MDALSLGEIVIEKVAILFGTVTEFFCDELWPGKSMDHPRQKK